MQTAGDGWIWRNPVSRTLDARHIPHTLTQGYQLSSPLSLSCFSQHYKHLGRQCFEQPLAIFTHGIELWVGAGKEQIKGPHWERKGQWRLRLSTSSPNQTSHLSSALQHFYSPWGKLQGISLCHRLVLLPLFFTVDIPGLWQSMQPVRN